MERERLTRLLQEPGQVGREDLAALRELTERYPWFSGAHLLRAMGEHAQGELLLDGTVHTAAAHVPTREVLFDALHTPLPAEHKRTPTVGSGPSIVPQSTGPDADVLGTSVEDVPVTETPSMSPEPDPQAAPPAYTASDQAGDPQMGPEATHELEATPEASHEEEVTPAIDESAAVLEQQMLEAALSAGYALTRQSAEEAVPSTDPLPPLSEKKGASGIADEETPVASTPQEKAMDPTPVEDAPPPVVSPRGRMRFTDWLTMAGTDRTGEVSPEPDTIQPENPGVAEDRSPEGRSADLEKTTLSVADTGGLIDRFIASQHPPPRPKTAFFKPQEAARRSVEEHAGLVTETLARIHEAQGNTAKAMDMYKRLALKYPEKSAYFAALAKKLEE